MKIVDCHRCDLIKVIAENNDKHILGMRPEFLPHFKIDEADNIIGKKFLVQYRYNDETLKVFFRMEGYTINHSYRLQNVTGSDSCLETLNKNGRFCDSYQVVDRDHNGNPIWAYEREKVFKKLNDAVKKSKPGTYWIQLRAVQFWDDKTDYGKGNEAGCWEIE